MLPHLNEEIRQAGKLLQEPVYDVEKRMKAVHNYLLETGGILDNSAKEQISRIKNFGCMMEIIRNLASNLDYRKLEIAWNKNRNEIDKFAVGFDRSAAPEELMVKEQQLNEKLDTMLTDQLVKEPSLGQPDGWMIKNALKNTLPNYDKKAMFDRDPYRNNERQTMTIPMGHGR